MEKAVNSSDVQSKSFDVALKTLSGESSAADDPLGSQVSRILSDSRSKYDGMTDEERVSLVQLTEEQKNKLVQNDQALEKAYLTKTPDLSAVAVTNNKVYMDVIKKFK